MINEPRSSAGIVFLGDDREGHEFTRAINAAKFKRLLAAAISFVCAQIFPQGLKPALWLGLSSTLRRASLAQGGLKTKAMPFPFLLSLDSTVVTESPMLSTSVTSSHA
jgi:hypothetical protein